jgi:hypothetical protein
MRSGPGMMAHVIVMEIGLGLSVKALPERSHPGGSQIQSGQLGPGNSVADR